MRFPLSLFAVITTLIPLPAGADPLEITVYGGYTLPDTSPRFHYRYDRIIGDPWSHDFDPAAAAVNAYAASHPKPGRTDLFNIDRMITLERTGDSIVGHQLKCQARFATYDLITDTYLGANGIPQPCRL